MAGRKLFQCCRTLAFVSVRTVCKSIHVSSVYVRTWGSPSHDSGLDNMSRATQMLLLNATLEFLQVLRTPISTEKYT